MAEKSPIETQKMQARSMYPMKHASASCFWTTHQAGNCGTGCIDYSTIMHSRASEQSLVNVMEQVARDYGWHHECMWLRERLQGLQRTGPPSYWEPPDPRCRGTGRSKTIKRKGATTTDIKEGDLIVAGFKLEIPGHQKTRTQDHRHKYHRIKTQDPASARMVIPFGSIGLLTAVRLGNSVLITPPQQEYIEEAMRMIRLYTTLCLRERSLPRRIAMGGLLAKDTLLVREDHGESIHIPRQHVKSEDILYALQKGSTTADLKNTDKKWNARRRASEGGSDESKVTTTPQLQWPLGNSGEASLTFQLQNLPVQTTKKNIQDFLPNYQIRTTKLEMYVDTNRAYLDQNGHLQLRPTVEPLGKCKRVKAQAATKTDLETLLQACQGQGIYLQDREGTQERVELIQQRRDTQKEQDRVYNARLPPEARPHQQR